MFLAFKNNHTDSRSVTMATADHLFSDMQLSKVRFNVFLMYFLAKLIYFRKT